MEVMEMPLASLGEAVVFGVSATVLIYEYQRSKAQRGGSKWSKWSRCRDALEDVDLKFDEIWISVGIDIC